MRNDATTGKVSSWLRGRLPEAWSPEEVHVTVDREEVTVLLPLPGGAVGPDGAAPDDEEVDGGSRGSAPRAAPSA